MMFCAAVKSLLETYVIGDVVPEADDNLMQLTLPWNKGPVEYAEAFQNKVLRSGRVYK